MESCEPDQMFRDMQQLIENTGDDGSNDDVDPYTMPVRKFYNNTFDDLTNRAIFSLLKKQMQHPDEMEYFTTEGMIKFVAFQLLDSPPDGEIDQKISDVDSR